MTAPATPKRPPLLPVPDVWTAPFWEHAAAGQLALQQCEACDQLRYPPGPGCPACGGSQHRWRVLSGQATVQSWVTFHQVYYPEYDIPVPYTVALIRLAEGPQMIAGLDPGTAPQIGLPVVVGFRRLTDSVALPFFQAARP